MLLALAQGEHLVYAASPRLWALALLHFGRYNFFTSFLQFTKSMMLFTQDAVLLALENVILLQVQFFCSTAAKRYWGLTDLWSHVQLSSH